MPEPAARRPRTGEFLTIGEWRQVKARFTRVIERGVDAEATSACISPE